MPQFYGQNYIRPQVVSIVDDTRLAGPNDINTINIAVLGVATGGAPMTALTFTSAREARRVLRSGELLDAIERAYAPGPNQAGAYRVTAIRVNAATRATATLQTATQTNAIVLTSVDYGLHTNQISVAVAAGTTAGTKITVQKAASSIAPAILVVGDNIYRSGIKVRYGADFDGNAIAGATGSAATLTVAYTGTPTALLTTSVTGATGDNLSIDLLTYTSLQQVVDQINATGKYTAAVVGPDPNAAATTIDAVSTASCYGTNLTTTANLQAQIDFFNSLSDVVSAAAATNAHTPADVVAQTFLAGGGEGTVPPSNGSWQSAFDILQTEDVQLVVPVSGDAAIHAMAAAHCASMSNAQNKAERVAILGGVLGESVTQVKTRATTLNSDRAQIVWPGGTDLDPLGTGTTKNIAPYLLAAQKAGITAGLPSGRAATYQNIGITGLETKLTTSQVEDLLIAGVCPFEAKPRGGFRVVQDITTWQADTRFSRRELSTRLALDIVSRTLRAALEPFIGSVNGPYLQAEVASDIAATLEVLTKRGVLVGGPGNPAYTNLTITVRGDIVEVAVQVSIAVPANYFFLTIFPTVFNSALAVSR